MYIVNNQIGLKYEIMKCKCSNQNEFLLRIVNGLKTSFKKLKKNSFIQK